MDSPSPDHTFTAVEELSGFFAALEWPVQYIQLEPGRLASRISSLESDSWFLAKEQTSRRMEAQAAAPEGMYVLALVEGNPVVANGQEVTASDVFFQSPDSSFRVTLPANSSVVQLGIRADLFEEAFTSYQDKPVLPSGVLSLPSRAPRHVTRLFKDMTRALHKSSAWEAAQEELISNFTDTLIHMAFDKTGALAGERIRCTEANRVLRRAFDYIDGHLVDSIKIPVVAQYSGTTVRSLERIFASEMGTTPQQYIKARRLDAVRRSLVGTHSSEGVTVTELAQGFGFSHMGRFSQYYRAYFGESPRETLLTE